MENAETTTRRRRILSASRYYVGWWAYFVVLISVVTFVGDRLHAHLTVWDGRALWAHTLPDWWIKLPAIAVISSLVARSQLRSAGKRQAASVSGTPRE